MTHTQAHTIRPSHFPDSPCVFGFYSALQVSRFSQPQIRGAVESSGIQHSVILSTEPRQHSRYSDGLRA
jgi:hypothetical protein